MHWRLLVYPLYTHPKRKGTRLPALGLCSLELSDSAGPILGWAMPSQLPGSVNQTKTKQNKYPQPGLWLSKRPHFGWGTSPKCGARRPSGHQGAYTVFFCFFFPLRNLPLVTYLASSRDRPDRPGQSVVLCCVLCALPCQNSHGSRHRRCGCSCQVCNTVWCTAVWSDAM